METIFKKHFSFALCCVSYLLNLPQSRWHNVTFWQLYIGNSCFVKHCQTVRLALVLHSPPAALLWSGQDLLHLPEHVEEICERRSSHLSHHLKCLKDGVTNGHRNKACLFRMFSDFRTCECRDPKHKETAWDRSKLTSWRETMIWWNNWFLFPSCSFHPFVVCFIYVKWKGRICKRCQTRPPYVSAYNVYMSFSFPGFSQWAGSHSHSHGLAASDGKWWSIKVLLVIQSYL